MLSLLNGTSHVGAEEHVKVLLYFSRMVAKSMKKYVRILMTTVTLARLSQTKLAVM